jgi:hypothetical protein
MFCPGSTPAPCLGISLARRRPRTGRAHPVIPAASFLLFPRSIVRNSPVRLASVAHTVEQVCATPPRATPALRTNIQITAQQGSDGDLLSGLPPQRY